MPTFSRALRVAELDAHNAKKLVEFSRETDPAPLRPGSLPGDEMALRGIPAIGRGVGGAIPGTRPGAFDVFESSLDPSWFPR